MIRFAPALSAVLFLAGCDSPTPAPAPPSTENMDGGGFGNDAVQQSIMQPKVIAEVEPTPTPAPTPPPPPTGATVLFAKGSTLDDTGRAALDRLLAAPGLPAGAAWVLRGSSDSPGRDIANLATSRRRALAVQAYLVENGVDEGRITVVALGERRPAAPNANLDGSDDPEGRARNRRVDVEIVPPALSAPTPSPTPTPTPTSTAAPATG